MPKADMLEIFASLLNLRVDGYQFLSLGLLLDYLVTSITHNQIVMDLVI
jgi:hypothetical protein